MNLNSNSDICLDLTGPNHFSKEIQSSQSYTKKARVNATKEILEEYVANLKECLQNVPPENIYNYDEINLTDDPDQKKKCGVKRGEKYPVNLRKTSKTSISMLLSGNAIGDILPPVVVYKSVRLWSSWVTGGPEGSRYNNTPSGCFDGFAFEEWFLKSMLPVLKKKAGVKVLIGDNLTSHISGKILEQC